MDTRMNGKENTKRTTSRASNAVVDLACTTGQSPGKGSASKSHPKKQPLQLVLLPPVYPQSVTAKRSPDNQKAQERLNQLLEVLVEAALRRLSELSQDEKYGKAL